MPISRIAGRATAGIALAAAMGIAGGVAFAAVMGTGDTPPADQRPNYAVNSRGESYGSSAIASSPDLEPDLILVVTDQGPEGYVRKTDLDPPDFKSPAEAIAWQTNRDAAGPQVLSVFRSDGVSKVGTFTLTPGDGVLTTVPRTDVP